LCRLTTAYSWRAHPRHAPRRAVRRWRSADHGIRNREADRPHLKRGSLGARRRHHLGGRDTHRPPLGASTRLDGYFRGHLDRSRYPRVAPGTWIRPLTPVPLAPDGPRPGWTLRERSGPSAPRAVQSSRGKSRASLVGHPDWPRVEHGHDDRVDHLVGNRCAATSPGTRAWGRCIGDNRSRGE